ncbi:ADP-ribosylglycohydrolase family protein [aff. Roholtiella sp. LEGE 12411]|uniref:ADP-ribosylglycohydrolase family protein n=1 Tax=aff. Roholtiella sp. LEGE 12411 TaxID=1828822 RepID=UPI001881ED0F|nr:ADP-ribosylglycohydrolase family protein [aff. Roholtiella sp. LEGE 12411]MBE9035442.1 ADP-ribosylglycohydrolase family protein [aff. Roholtiella sp. LEGE 12411]
MRYSVVSRFRGTLLGAILGESLASNRETKSESCLHFGKMAILGTKSLITLGRLDLNDWIALQHKEYPHLDATDISSIEVILATLPVALFFHDNTIKLRQNLLRVLQIWEDDPVVRDGTLAIGYAIAQSLNEKLHPLTLIPQTISFLGETPTSVPQQLLKVHALLTQGSGLERAQAELNREEKLSNIIAMAFYCFLSTLEDFRLAVLRATHSSNSQVQETTRLSLQATGAITGALSGAYNSTEGIPVNWWGLVSQANLTTRGLTNFSQMLELADALLAVWSGVYDFTLNPSELKEDRCAIFLDVAPLSVYAAPRVIRSR